jgi:hypothetical protein
MPAAPSLHRAAPVDVHADGIDAPGDADPAATRRAHQPDAHARALDRRLGPRHPRRGRLASSDDPAASLITPEPATAGDPGSSDPVARVHLGDSVRSRRPEIADADAMKDALTPFAKSR